MQRAAFSALKTPKGRAPSSIPHVRFNSSSAPKNAQEKAQEAANKAVEQAKKYVNPETISSLQKSAGKLASKGVELLGPVGQRAGNLLGGYKEPTLYNLAVAREVVKHVYRAEGLAPPRSLSAVQAAYRQIWAKASSPAFWRESFRSGEILRLGIYGLEAYGIFKLGEIVGRRSLIGYNVQH